MQGHVAADMEQQPKPRSAELRAILKSRFHAPCSRNNVRRSNQACSANVKRGTDSG
jgi:hypothetical protein